MVQALMERLENWSWDAAVLGLGYVGLPLIVTMARAGIDVTGFDVNPEVVERLTTGRSHVDDVTDEDLAEVAARTRFTARIEDIKERDVLFICVPTPTSRRPPS